MPMWHVNYMVSVYSLQYTVSQALALTKIRHSCIQIYNIDGSKARAPIVLQQAPVNGVFNKR